MGTVLIPPKEVDDDKVVSPLKPVIRVATDEDEKTVERNKEKEKGICHLEGENHQART